MALAGGLPSKGNEKTSDFNLDILWLIKLGKGSGLVGGFIRAMTINALFYVVFHFLYFFGYLNRLILSSIAKNLFDTKKIPFL